MPRAAVQFGVCVPLEHAQAAQAAGWDFVEVVASTFLDPSVPIDRWRGRELARSAPLPIRAANRLIPAHLPVTGPAASLDALTHYMTVAVERAADVGIELLVFGSGPARMIPPGFERTQARQQLIDFCRAAGTASRRRRIVLAIEPLNRGECNVMNSVREVMQYVRAVELPSVRCLLDSYHLWLEDEPLDHVRAALPWIAHVHLADVRNRAAPGTSGQDDYRALFSLLKGGGYAGRIAIESIGLESLPRGAAGVLNFVKAEWSAA